MNHLGDAVHQVGVGVRRRSEGARLVAGLARRDRDFALALGYFGFGNLGDEALADLFRARSELDVAASDFPRWLTALLAARPQRFGNVRQIVLPGGTLIGRWPWSGRLRELHRLFPEASMWGLGVGVEDPAELAAADAGAWRREVDQLLDLAPKMAVLSVRGPRSREVLAAAGLDLPWAGDPALLLGPKHPPPRTEERSVLVTVGAVDRVAGASQRHLAGLLQQSVSYLVRAGWRATVMPVYGIDRAEVRALAAHVGGAGLRVAPVTTSWRRFQEAASRHRVGLHVRLHPSVLSAATFAPHVQLSYLPKCDDFADTIGARPLAVAGLRPGAVVDAVEEAAQHWDSRRLELVEAVGAARARLELHFAGAADALAARSVPK